MKEKFNKRNWFMGLVYKGNFMCAFLLAPTANVDSCCEIDGEYYEDGTVNPENACEICDITKSLTSWSPAAAGTSCDYCLHCDNNGSCSEKNDNCCSTLILSSSGCVPPPDLLLEPGCIFTSSAYSGPVGPPEFNWFAGVRVSLICEDTGLFDLHELIPSGPYPCESCFWGLTESFEVTACSVSYPYQSFECAEPSCPGGCFIDSSCFADGAPHPDNTCLLCDGAQSIWMPAPIGASCGDCLLCSVDGACSTPDEDC